MSDSLRTVRAGSTSLLLAIVCAACGGGTRTTISPAPVPVAMNTAATQRVVAGESGRDITFAQMADAAARADVVFFGEQHDDAETHRAELELLTAIGDRRGTVILSLEMFERDVQGALDAYLAGTLSETDFLAQSRPWPNYAADYRPLLELAKAKKWPVVASNVPRRLASMVSRQGLAAVDSLPAADRALVAKELLCPKDQYYANFVDVMGGGHGAAPSAAASASPMTGMTDLFYQAQCIKDETMAEAIVLARARSGVPATIVHVTGSFHSDFGLGTAARVRRRIPGLNSIVVSAVPTPVPAKAKVAELTARGQYIIFVLRAAP